MLLQLFIIFTIFHNNHKLRPHCLLRDDWVNIWPVYAMDEDSSMKEKKILVICNNMDGPRRYLCEVSESEKDRCTYH